MGRHFFHMAVVAGLALATWTVPVAAANPGAAESTPTAEVSFTVRNINRSSLPCLPDGKTYTLRGTLVGPEDKLASDAVELATVYVHDFATGGWFWKLPASDHVGELAEDGHISLVIDRLGYGSSPRPPGGQICLGSQADMIHQVIQQFRSGSYESAAGSPSAKKVVLAGHSVGAGIAELEAASFRDVDGLVLMSWADAGPSLRAITEATTQTTKCLFGGDSRVPQRGYAFFGQDPSDFKGLLLHSAPPAVQDAAAARRSADPCGDVLLLAPMIAANNILTHTISVPVLLLFGDKDALNRPEARLLQSLAYGPGASVTTKKLTNTGSALPLETTAPQTREFFATWVCGSFGCPPSGAN